MAQNKIVYLVQIQHGCSGRVCGDEVRDLSPVCHLVQTWELQDENSRVLYRAANTKTRKQTPQLTLKQKALDMAKIRGYTVVEKGMTL